MARSRGKVALASAVLTGLYLASHAGGRGHGGLNLSSLIPAKAVSAPAPSAQGGSPAANEQLGNQLAARGYGWAGAQAACLDVLWQGESGWRTNADTRASGLDSWSSPVYAYGIPQARPAQKMAAAGADWQSNPATQIRWGLGYIHDRYGNPCAALAFKRSTGNQGY